MLRESVEPEFWRFLKAFSYFSRLDMKNGGLRLAKEEIMSDDRLTLIAECHGDNILCNGFPLKVRSL